MNNLKLLGLVAMIFLVGSIFASQASAQYQPGTRSFQGQRTPVNGTYVNSNYGFQITLPDGWSGFEMKRTSGATSVMAAPGGFSMQQGQRPSTSVMINVESKSTNPTPMLMSQRMSQNMTCNNDSNLVKTINGISITEVVVDCSGSNGMLKAKYDIAQTNSSYIVIGYRANSAANYDSQVAAFDSAVGTLQVSNALGAPAIPEFPISIVAVIAAIMMGTVVIFGRLRLVPGSV